MQSIVSFVGLCAMVLLAYALSSARAHIRWRTVLLGLLLQLVFGFFILNTGAGRVIFEGAKEAFQAVLNFTNYGSEFIFGDLAKPQKVGFVFATMVLPTIIFMSSLMSVLYHIGIMQKLVEFSARIMMKFMGTSGAESLSAAANVFVGQTEAPLVIKPYVAQMTRSEIMALMSGGMATVAGGVLASYVGMGIDAGHLLAASVMSAPASLAMAKLMVPETQESVTAGVVKINLPKTSVNTIDAAASGAAEGLKLALNVGAMLLAFIALVAMLNGILSLVGGWFSYPELSFELILGVVFYPFALLMGVPWEDCFAVGTLLGKKMVVNEFVAYLDLTQMLDTLQPRSITISTYALCGFANFSSIAIQIGGIGTLAPEKRQELAQLGIKSLIGGTLACFMTACVVGIFI